MDTARAIADVVCVLAFTALLVTAGVVVLGIVTGRLYK
jgi:hypothetical protein